MKLTRVRIKDFRSLAGEHDFNVADGLNYFVGQNNAGKSNVLRAIELALDSDASYDSDRDRPARNSTAGGAPVKTRIILTFKIGSTGPEATLKRHAAAYERRLRGERGARNRTGSATYAGDGIVQLVTEFGSAGTRVTTFQAKGVGALSLPADSAEHIALERQFRAVVRFAVIHSGEDLESLLKGKFRDILNLVISEHLREEVARAESSRETYLAALKSELLEPLRGEVERRVSAIFKEISGVELLPSLPTVQETLASVEVRLVDALTSSLTDKGTGVRGAVLVAMLQYLATQSRRSLVLAVEEPEAFLHPGAQEAIREELESLADQDGVTLLVTTHSPYVIARTSDSVISLVSKGNDGISRVGQAVSGSDPLGETLGSLYREAYLSDVLERSLAIPPSSIAVLVTEGYTDWAFIEMGCRAAGRLDLTAGIHVIVADKAKNVVPQAVIARAATQVPVVALLDFDDAGKAAAEKLESFGWNKSKGLLLLNKWPDRCASGHDVEIEDLLPADATFPLAQALGEELSIDAKERCGSTWHYKFSQAWKTAAVGDFREASAPIAPQLPTYLDASNAPEGGIVWLLEEVHRRAASMRGQ